MNDFLSPEYWSNRYIKNEAGWDLGVISRPLKEYVDQLTNKSLKILIPGCGTGHEGAYLFANGFQNVHLLDFSSEALAAFKKQVPNFPNEQLFVNDFFEFEGQYDLILEQTLFCAINPDLRAKYAEHVSKLLKPGGKLVGLLFNKVFESGPPFGGSKEEYLNYFNPYFSQIEMKECYNSIEPRKGNELFIQLVK